MIHTTTTDARFASGLMALPDKSGGDWPSFTYHMFFQSNDPGQGLGSIWGHASSPDLVHWTRMNRTGIRGSSGGGVSLPTGTAAHNDWRGAAFASVPLFPPKHPAVGLSLWYSTDEDLTSWKLYQGQPGECAGTLGPNSAVICPGEGVDTCTVPTGPYPRDS